MCDEAELVVKLPRRGSAVNAVTVANVRQILMVNARRGSSLVISTSSTLTELSFGLVPETVTPIAQAWCRIPFFPQGIVRFVMAENTQCVEILATTIVQVAIWPWDSVPHFTPEPARATEDP